MRGTVAGILLAAGEGYRFGRPKALAELGGRALVERGTATLAEGGCRPVVVVLGAAAGEVQRATDLGSALVVVNDRWTEGMGSSLRTGLAEAVRCRASAALVLPVDQPMVSPDLVARLISAWRHGSMVARAAYGGHGRTPVVLDRSWWPAVAVAAVGDRGARVLLQAQAEMVTLVDCDDVGAPWDIDTPEDLAALERGSITWHSRGRP